MRIARFILISIFVTSVIVTIISLFVPSHIRLSRAVQINSSREAVMEQLSDPAKWRSWYPGADSSNFYRENGSVKGLILGENKKQLIIIDQKKEDEVTAFYSTPRRKIATGWQVAVSPGGNSVTVQWYMDFDLKWYPWEKFSSFLFEKVYNPQLQKGLDNLKSLLEK